MRGSTSLKGRAAVPFPWRATNNSKLLLRHETSFVCSSTEDFFTVVVISLRALSLPDPPPLSVCCLSFCLSHLVVSFLYSLRPPTFLFVFFLPPFVLPFARGRVATDCKLSSRPTCSDPKPIKMFSGTKGTTSPLEIKKGLAETL